MIGILIEVIVAGGTAIEDLQTRQIANKNDPINGKISDVSAVVYFVVKGGGVLDMPQKGDRAGMMLLCKTTQIASSLPGLFADNFNRGWGVSNDPNTNSSDTRAYSLRFQTDGMTAMQVGSGQTWQVKEIFDVKYLWMTFSFLTNNAEILGGTASVVVNGSVRREFVIITQVPYIFKPGFPCWIIATNFDRPSEK